MKNSGHIGHPYELGGKKSGITDLVVQIKNPLIDGGEAVIPGLNDDLKEATPD